MPVNAHQRSSNYWNTIQSPVDARHPGPRRNTDASLHVCITWRVESKRDEKKKQIQSQVTSIRAFAHVHRRLHCYFQLHGINSNSIWDSLSRRSWWRCPEIQSSLEFLVCRFCIELIRYLSNLSDVHFVVFLKAKGRTRPKTLSQPKSLFHACWDQRGQTLGLRTKTLQFVFSSPHNWDVIAW